MFGITFGISLLAGFVIGIIACAIVVFFVWRNNKKKFTQALFDIDVIVSKYDTAEEIKIKINEALAKIKK